MEGGEIKFNKAEYKEDFEIEMLLKKLFESEKAVKTNEGHNGIILEVNLDELSEEERNFFCSYFNLSYEAGKSKAIKMIKIFHSEKAEKEFLAQVKASEVINNNENVNSAIGVPECYFGGELIINDVEVKERLRGYGVNFSDNRLGLMMMDYIKGEDLGIYCYKQFIKINFDQFKKTASIEGDVDPDEYDLYLSSYSINDLVLACHDILGIRAKYNYFDDSYEARQERSQIAEAILGGLENKGFLKKDLVDSLRQSISILHDNNIYHRDLHLRNLILGQDGKMHLVDFGSAKVLPENASELDLRYVYQSDDGREMQADDSILRFLDKMATTPEEHEQEEINQRLKKALEIKELAFGKIDSKRLSRLEKKVNEAKKKLEKNISTDMRLGNLIKAFSNDLGTFSGDQYFDYQIAGLMILIDLGYEERVKNFCLELNNDNSVNQVFLSKINSLIKTL